MKPPKNDALLIFAGPADIDDGNMRQLLENWLPEDLGMQPPVIQRTLLRGTRNTGLKKVLAWLEEQFKDDIDRPDDIAEYLSGLETSEETYLVVLWGDGGDEATETLIDAASRRGITVLDLTDGLEELALSDSKPEQPAPARSQRRTRSAAGTEPATGRQAAAPEDERPPWEASGDSMQAARTLAYVLSKGHQQIADAHQEFARLLAEFSGTAAEVSPAAAPGAVPGTAAPAAKPEGPRIWLQNPADEKEYRLKGRGRPRNELKTWKEVKLTPEQEAALGLA